MRSHFVIAQLKAIKAMSPVLFRAFCSIDAALHSAGYPKALARLKRTKGDALLVFDHVLQAFAILDGEHIALAVPIGSYVLAVKIQGKVTSIVSQVIR